VETRFAMCPGAYGRCAGCARKAFVGGFGARGDGEEARRRWSRRVPTVGAFSGCWPVANPSRIIFRHALPSTVMMRGTASRTSARTSCGTLPTVYFVRSTFSWRDGMSSSIYDGPKIVWLSATLGIFGGLAYRCVVGGGVGNTPPILSRLRFSSLQPLLYAPSKFLVHYFFVPSGHVGIGSRRKGLAGYVLRKWLPAFRLDYIKTLNSGLQNWNVLRRSQQQLNGLPSHKPLGGESGNGWRSERIADRLQRMIAAKRLVYEAQRRRRSPKEKRVIIAAYEPVEGGELGRREVSNIPGSHILALDGISYGFHSKRNIDGGIQCNAQCLATAVQTTEWESCPTGLNSPNTLDQRQDCCPFWRQQLACVTPEAGAFVVKEFYIFQGERDLATRTDRCHAHGGAVSVAWYKLFLGQKAIPTQDPGVASSASMIPCLLVTGGQPLKSKEAPLGHPWP